MNYTTLALFALSTLITACGGGSGGGGDSTRSLPPSVPTATVSGSAVDGLILQGTVSVYNFASGTKGALLGTSTTDNVGHYSMTIQAESMPILIEVVGGYYIEEASGIRVSLQPDQKLTALKNFRTASAISMAVTPWTHAAAALAIYNYRKGISLAAAIDSANTRISNSLGINIENTIPVDVSNLVNQSSSLTPAIQYGWMSAAISQWTFNALANTPLRQHSSPFASINYSQLMYDDMLTDGLLNGIGIGGQLSFGTTALGVDVYRHGLAVDMLEFAGNSNNKTGLTKTQLLAAARNFANNADPIWDGVIPIAIENPSVTLISPTAGTWVHGIVPVSATVVDATGLISASLKVDGNPVSSITSGTLAPSILWDSTTISDGNHSVGLEAMNTAGLTGSSSVSVRVDNTQPVISLTGYSVQSSNNWRLPVCLISGNSSDYGSGLSSMTISLSDNTGAGTESISIPAPNDSWQIALTQHVGAASPPFNAVATLTIEHGDVAGNRAVLTRTVRSYATIVPKIGYFYTFCELQ